MILRYVLTGSLTALGLVAACSSDEPGSKDRVVGGAADLGGETGQSAGAPAGASGGSLAPAGGASGAAGSDNGAGASLGGAAGAAAGAESRGAAGTAEMAGAGGEGGGGPISVGGAPASTTCAAPLGLSDVSQPTSVVGDGTPASCTEALLVSAIATGGVIRFDCGTKPFTLVLSAELLVTKDTVIDGEGLVTLSGGKATRLLAIRGNVSDAGPELTVQRLRLTDGFVAAAANPGVDHGGAAIFVKGGKLRVIDSTFEHNHGSPSGADEAGGAVDAQGADVVITGSTFTDNSASNGGALGALSVKQLKVVNSLFSSNTATGNGGVTNGGNGGAIYADGLNFDVPLCGVELRDNSAGALGGGFFRTGYQLADKVQLERSSVFGNQAVDGAGGMYLQGLTFTALYSTVAYNQAPGRGGLALVSGDIALTHVTVAHNTAPNQVGGGIGFGSTTTGALNHVTVAYNSALFNSGVVGATSGVKATSSLFVNNVATNGYNAINCGGSFSDGGSNLQWPLARSAGGSDDPNALCAAGIAKADPQLGPLQENGGPVQTALPSASGPAAGLGAGIAP